MHKLVRESTGRARKEMLERRIWVRVQGDLPESEVMVPEVWPLYQQHWRHMGAG